MRNHLSILTSALSLGLSLGLGLGFTPGLTLAPAHAALLVGNTRGNNVGLYGDDGSFRGDFIAPGAGGLVDPDALTFGPDGNLYVSSGDSSSGKILRYSGATGEFLGDFATSGLIRPYGSAFGPDGNFYVSSFLTDEIVRFDGKTGAFIDVFAAAPKTDRQSGQLNGPNGLLFTPDGRLLVTTQGSVAVADPTKPGAFKASFADGWASQVLSYDIRLMALALSVCWGCRLARKGIYSSAILPAILVNMTSPRANSSKRFRRSMTPGQQAARVLSAA
jgi:secreted PhoX family phosphatase